MIDELLEKTSRRKQAFEKSPSADTAYSLMLASQELARACEEIYREREDSPSEARRKVLRAAELSGEVSLRETEEEYILTIPPLLNKKKGLTVPRSLGERIEMAAWEHGVERKAGRSVTFRNLVHAARSVQDYDNLDTRAVLNILAEIFLADDNWYVYSLHQCAKVIPDYEEERCEIYITK